MDIELLDVVFGFILSALSIAFPVWAKRQNNEAKTQRALGVEQNDVLDKIADALDSMAAHLDEIKKQDLSFQQSFHQDLNAQGKEIARMSGLLDGMKK